MNFHDFIPRYDIARRLGLTLTPRQFLQALLNETEQQYGDRQNRSFELIGYEAETAWIELDRPYYKVWPGVIPLLAGVRIDMPGSYLHAPFDAFVLRLPKVDNPLIVDEQHPIQSIIVAEGLGEDDNRVILLWLDYGERIDGLVPKLACGAFRCLPDQTIEEAFWGKGMTGLQGMKFSDELKDRCLRLVVSVCFLSTGMDRLIEPDVLSKDLAAYIEAHQAGDESKSKKIEHRAIRRGKRGWNVGKHERLRPLVSRSGKNISYEAIIRGPHTHQHQRRAHFRILANDKVTFVRQATVRPDLPPPDRAPGYGLR